MLYTLLKISQRYLLKNRFFSLINILGLAFGLTCSLLILLWVWDELRFDQFHENGENIYQVMAQLKSDGEEKIIPYAPSALAQPLKERLPEVTEVCRVFPSQVVFGVGKARFSEEGIYADPTFLSIFTFPLKERVPGSILSEPQTIVISETLAEKYFPGESALGKIISITQGENETFEYQVTGVLKAIPRQSSLQFDYIMAYQQFEDRYRPWWSATQSGGAYTNFNVNTYIKVAPNVDIKALNNKLGSFIENFTSGNVQDGLFAYPFEKHYLYGDFSVGKEPAGRIQYVRLLSIVAVIVLVIAAINSMNLSIATATKRAKEVGLRKSIGATRFQLFIQFMAESALVALVSMAIAITLADSLLPFFNLLTQKHIQIPFSSPAFILIVVGVVFLTGILAGWYPAIYMSAFSPARKLKNANSPRGGLVFIRKVLVIFQFAMSIVFIVYTIVVYSQINFIENKDLGIQKENILHHDLHTISARSEMYRNELLQIPGVKHVSFTEQNPLSTSNGNRFVNWKGKPQDALVYFNVMQVDRDFLKTFELRLLEGTNFPHQYSEAGEHYFIINQEAVRAMGVDNPIGLEMEVWGHKGKVVGVVANFNHQPLTKGIEPVVMVYNPEEVYQAFISVAPDQLSETINEINQVYNKYETGYAFDYSFVENDYKGQYSQVITTGKLNYMFAVAGILISCIGLLGLSAIVTEQRTKETGIRKVLGASVWSLLQLFTIDFLKLIVAAFLLAVPVAWLYSDVWLSDFAYRIDVGIAPFILAGTSVLVIALLTVGSITLKVAKSNPVDSLKYE